MGNTCCKFESTETKTEIQTEGGIIMGEREQVHNSTKKQEGIIDAQQNNENINTQQIVQESNRLATNFSSLNQQNQLFILNNPKNDEQNSKEIIIMTQSQINKSGTSSSSSNLQSQLKIFKDFSVNENTKIDQTNKIYKSDQRDQQKKQQTDIIFQSTQVFQSNNL